MSATPVVSFFNRDTNVDLSISGWSVGQVKADESSDVLELRVWNNKGGAELASTMQDCELFILDSSDAKIEPIVTEGWLQGKCISLGDTTFKSLDDTEILNIGSSELSDYQIGGATNDGGEAGNSENYSDIDLRFDVPFGATHGDKNFSIAVKYFFV